MSEQLIINVMRTQFYSELDACADSRPHSYWDEDGTRMIFVGIEDELPMYVDY
jgi:hypothetical protein